jgi:hypothetical protein
MRATTEKISNKKYYKQFKTVHNIVTSKYNVFNNIS